jgi:hypothetical protein
MAALTELGLRDSRSPTGTTGLDRARFRDLAPSVPEQARAVHHQSAFPHFGVPTMSAKPPSLLQPWKQHWLFVPALFVVGPALGFLLAADRGLLFGLAISVFASVWLLWSRRERDVDG